MYWGYIRNMEDDIMLSLKLKRIGDHYFIIGGVSKLRTTILPHDFGDEDRDKVYDVCLTDYIAIVKLDNGKELSTGFHSDYIRKYFEV